MDGNRGRTGGTIDVAYVARLARLDLTDQERDTFQEQLGHVLTYVEKIRELDLSGVEPTSHAGDLRNVFRADDARPGLDPAEVMRNAPAARDGLFMVPKIIE